LVVAQRAVVSAAAELASLAALRDQTSSARRDCWKAEKPVRLHSVHDEHAILVAFVIPHLH
jgi:hypothetical protein